MGTATFDDIEAQRDRIRTADACPDEDRENLLECSKIMARNRTHWGYERHLSVLQRLIMLSWGGTKYDAEEFHDTTLSATLTSEAAAGEIVDWINRTYTNEETNRDMRGALRTFGKVLTSDDPTSPNASPPPSLDWISATTPRNHKPLPRSADMITWQEAKAMCDHPRTNPRDAALIAVAWDAGPRSGELQDLTVGDVSDHDLGKTIRVEGKTGPREVTITNAVPYLRQWLNQHPAGDDPDAPLWSKLRSPEEISYRMFRDIFADAADRIDLNKPDDPTNFRKSSASTLASRGVSQAHLERRYGWTRGSDAAARYIRVFGDEADRALADARGMDVSLDDPDPTGPKQCKRCRVLIDREAERCDNCGFIQDRAQAQQTANSLSAQNLDAGVERPSTFDDLVATAEQTATERVAKRVLSELEETDISDEEVMESLTKMTSDNQ